MANVQVIKSSRLKHLHKFRRVTCSTIEIPVVHNTIALFFVAQALDKDSGAYGSMLYSIVHEEIPGIFLH